MAESLSTLLAACLIVVAFWVASYEVEVAESPAKLVLVVFLTVLYIRVVAYVTGLGRW